MEVIYGIHAVEEALNARGRSFEYVAVARDRHDAKVQRVIDSCRAAGIAVRFEGREHLNRLAKTASHQGVVAIAAQKKYNDLDEILQHKRGQHSFVVVLDGVEDPHNLGAILRTADAAGVDGVVLPERRAGGLTATFVKASAGASEHVPVAKVTNIARTVEELKSNNIWTVGLDERGSQPYDQVDYRMDCAIVLGAEGRGLHDLVRKKCDYLVSIPMMGKVPSLNVSVAGAVVMYEVARQRRAEK
jgi:23S rRNA (guanosine2251-2'-O)-methyltransferase